MCIPCGKTFSLVDLPRSYVNVKYQGQFNNNNKKKKNLKTFATTAECYVIELSYFIFMVVRPFL